MRKFLVVAVILLMITPALGVVPEPIYLTDQNSVVVINNQGEIIYWQVDDLDHLSKISWYYRIGDAGGELPLGLLSGTLNKVEDTYAYRNYINPGVFEAKVSWSLTGGESGSGTSDIATTLRLTNKSQSTLSIRLFQCSDFGLSGTADDDYGTLERDVVIKQWDSTTTVCESAMPQGILPTAWYIGPADTLWGWMEDDQPTTLPRTPEIGSTVGAGNLAWAFQWNFEIPASGYVSVIISKDILIHSTGAVPEPASLLTLCTGVIGLGGFILRKRR